jgi:hypothetical protein
MSSYPPCLSMPATLSQSAVSASAGFRPELWALTALWAPAGGLALKLVFFSGITLPRARPGVATSESVSRVSSACGAISESRAAAGIPALARNRRP